MRVVKVLVFGAASSFGLMAALLVFGKRHESEAPLGKAVQDSQMAERTDRRPLLTPPPNLGAQLAEEPLRKEDAAYLRARAEYKKLFDAKQYEEAIGRIEELLNRYPQDKGLSQDLSVVLYAAALEAFEAYDYERSVSWLRRSEALGYEPAKMALAQVFVHRGQAGEAIEILKGILSDGDDPRALESLVDLSLTRGNRADASLYLDRYEDLVQAAEPSLAKSETGSETSSDQKGFAKASREFFESRQKRMNASDTLTTQGLVLSRDEVRVRFPSEELESLAERVLSRSHRTIDSLKQRFGSLPLGADFDIELVPQEGFGELTGAPAWAGAVFDGTIRIPYPLGSSGRSGVSSHEALRIEQMAVHETTHAYLYELCGDRVPSWLGEGLAQMEEGRSGDSARQALSNLHGPSWQRFQPGENLDLPFVGVSDPTVARSLYLRALLLASRLEAAEGRDVWRRFLSLMCTSSRPLPESLEQSFGASSASALWTKVMGTP